MSTDQCERNIKTYKIHTVPVISDYVVNRPHIGIEFIHTNRKTPPPHMRPPKKKKGEDDDDDDEDEKEKSGEKDDTEKEKSGEIDKSGEVDIEEHEREKSDDRKLRLPEGSASYEAFEEDNHYVAVGSGKPTLWNPSEWSYTYPAPATQAESPATISKRFQACRNTGSVDCASYTIDRPVKYKPPQPIYVESVVSTESREKAGGRPPQFRDPPPRVSTGSSEKVWVKTWDKDKTGLPQPIDSTELNKN